MTQTTPAYSMHTSMAGGDESFPSPLLREVAERFDSTTRRVILEPGATSAGMLNLLEGKRCRLLVADAALALDALNDQALDGAGLAQEIERLIFDAGEEKIDTVLCWDLLNYLTPPLLKAFAARLAAIMTPTGVVHAYIHSAHATMPQHPQRYSLQGDDRVIRLDIDLPDRKAPRYSTWDLEKHGVGLRVERSMLLRNGMQEYLLRADPTHSGPREVKPVYRKRQH